MPVVREPLSISQLAELLGVEPWRVIDVEVNQLHSTAAIVLQPLDAEPHPARPQNRA